MKKKFANQFRTSLELLHEGFAEELIVVDDCSDDDTINIINSEFNSEVQSGKLKLHALDKNIGVTGAKNKGAQLVLQEMLNN